MTRATDMELKGNMRNLAGSIVFGLTLLATSVAAFPQTYSPPRDWKGKEAGATANNPVAVDGRAMWRFDQVWPDDPFRADAYQPMVWGGNQWIGPHEYGGQPTIAINRSSVLLAARGSWGGGEPTNGQKLAALTFIPPTAGTFTLDGTVTAEVWQGEGPVELLVLKRSAAGAVTEVAAFELAKADQQPGDLSGVAAVELVEGDELAFVAVVSDMYTAANFKVERLRVSAPAPDGSQPSP